MSKQEVTERVIGKLLDVLEQEDLLKDIEPTDYEEIVAGPVQNIIDTVYKEPEEPKLKWTDLKVGDVIRDATHIAMVTMIHNAADSMHVLAGKWLDDDELADWEKVMEETSE